ncbi:MAG: hypothetical protein FJ146_13490 [Deltaproteobacteria bacterium]|nr:hypothetical protein [Deltaproteobacteria bacterium]
MYWLMTALARLLTSLPDRVVDRLAWLLAIMAFDGLRVRRRTVLANLALAFPEKSPSERVSWGRISFYHFILTTFEFLTSSRLDLAGTVTMHDDVHLRTALAEGKGAYILCMHLGNWEAMGAACSRHFGPSHVLVKAVGTSGLNRFVSEYRERNGFHWVKRQRKGDGLKAIANILARREVVGFVMDQARPGEPKLPFFGHPAKTNTSFAAILRRYPAPVVPSFVIREGFHRHTEYFLPPVEVSFTDDAQADVLRHSAQFNKIVEDCVRRCPEQYFWLHNRWK